MTKREAKIEALRICSSVIQNSAIGLDYEGELSPIDETKIDSEIKKISDSLYNQAARLGGDFNQHTGFEHGRKISI